MGVVNASAKNLHEMRSGVFVNLRERVGDKVVPGGPLNTRYIFPFEFFADRCNVNLETLLLRLFRGRSKREERFRIGCHRYR